MVIRCDAAPILPKPEAMSGPDEPDRSPKVGNEQSRRGPSPDGYSAISISDDPAISAVSNWRGVREPFGHPLGTPSEAKAQVLAMGRSGASAKKE